MLTTTKQTKLQNGQRMKAVSLKLTGTLEPGATYTLHEVQTVDGYYYSYDIEFVVNTDGSEQIVEMQNRKIIVETPPDELPPDTPDAGRQGT